MAAKIFDFESIQARLKSYLIDKNNWDEILKYSDTHTLLDLQAFGEAELANYIEYCVRETKWDLAVNASSIYKGARFRGYNPQMKRSARGYVFFSADIDFTNPSTKRVIIPKYTEIQTGGQLPFVTTEQRILEIGAVEIAAPVIQGKMVSNLYTASGQGDFEYFKISDLDMEDSYFDVTVNNVPYTKFVSIYGAAPGELAFEVRKDNPTTTTFVFGSGRFGKKLALGDTVKITYIQSSGAEGNVLYSGMITKVSSQLYDNSGTFIQMYVKNKEKQSESISAILDGGQDEDDLNAIRSKALGSFTSGDRCITTGDYETQLLRSGYIQKVSVWGSWEIMKELGLTSWDTLPTNENLIYISAISPSGIPLTNEQQEIITLDIQDRKSPQAILRFVDPKIMGLFFTVRSFSMDKSVNLTDLTATIDAGLQIRYSLQEMDFKESIYDSMWRAEISKISGITHHNSSITLVREKSFDNYSEFYDNSPAASYLASSPDCFVTPVQREAGSIKIDFQYEDDSVWLECFILREDGQFDVTEDSLFTVDPDLSSINYQNGQMSLIFKPKLIGGVEDPLVRITRFKQIRVRYLCDSPDLILTEKKQIFKYYGSNITATYME